MDSVPCFPHSNRGCKWREAGQVTNPDMARNCPKIKILCERSEFHTSIVPRAKYQRLIKFPEVSSNLYICELAALIDLWVICAVKRKVEYVHTRIPRWHGMSREALLIRLII